MKQKCVWCFSLDGNDPMKKVAICKCDNNLWLNVSGQLEEGWIYSWKKSFMGECSVGAKLDWTDLEKSQHQVCLQTHWRTCRGKRRRPQDCSSLRGSSPSNCKFLMELMISACMSLIIPNTHTHTVRRGKEWGNKGWGENRQKEEGKGKEKKNKKREAGRDWTPLLPPPLKKMHHCGYPRKAHRLQDGWGSDIKRNFMHCSSVKNNPQNVSSTVHFCLHENHKTR